MAIIILPLSQNIPTEQYVVKPNTSLLAINSTVTNNFLSYEMQETMNIL